MKPHLLFAVSLMFALAIPAHGREPIDPLLQAPSKALDHYQQLAPGIHCEDATTKDLRDDCKIALDGLKSRVQEAAPRLHAIVGFPTLRRSIYLTPIRFFDV